LLIARNSQARRKSGVSAALSYVWRKIVNRAPEVVFISGY